MSVNFIDLRKKALEKQFSKMNDKQREAIFQTKGPLLILAGAGSGKTTVVVNRIANLIKFGDAYNSDYVPFDLGEEDIHNIESYINGECELSDRSVQVLAVRPVKPWKIMAITFTNKAAAELKERLSAMLGEENNEVWASTFHSSCAKILRYNADRLGYSNRFTIYDSDDSKRLIKECLKELNISEKSVSIKSVISEISKAKDELKNADEFKKEIGYDFRLAEIAKVYKLYSERLKASDAMDFDDLIVNTVKLFKDCPDVLEYYQNRIEYLMVDEYQDTNHAQYMLVKMLASGNENICVVGDDDQSIYKFRGATIENILSFEDTFGNAKTIKLEQNYRSTQNILDCANNIILNNAQRKGKNLWTGNGEGDKITLLTATDEREEAQKIAEQIAEDVRDGRNYSEIAILYRMGALSSIIETTLQSRRIPYMVWGGLRFYDRAEVKDILAYLCVINNTGDEIRLKRIINRPKRAIGTTTVDNVAQIANSLGISMFEVIKNADEYPMIAKASKKLKAFADLVFSWIEFSHDNSISQLFDRIIEDIDYYKFLEDDNPEKAEEKAQNLEELKSSIVRFEKEAERQELLPELSAYLEEIALYTEVDSIDANSDAVKLMTIHGAKGLEFPLVFLPAWEEGIFPSINRSFGNTDLEEERRLAYVAVTRAKEKLFISRAQKRLLFGTTARNQISVFAEELPDELVEKKGEQSSFSFSSQGSAQTYNNQVNTANMYKPKASVKSTDSYSEGDHVMHKTFGEGVILSTRPMGNDTLLEIAFEAGTKLLGANFAKLKKV